MIVKTDGVCSGEPRIDGRRITVENILTQFQCGVSREEIIEDFELSSQDIDDCFNYAIQLLRERD